VVARSASTKGFHHALLATARLASVSHRGESLRFRAIARAHAIRRTLAKPHRVRRLMRRDLSTGLVPSLDAQSPGWSCSRLVERTRSRFVRELSTSSSSRARVMVAPAPRGWRAIATGDCGHHCNDRRAARAQRVVFSHHEDDVTASSFQSFGIDDIACSAVLQLRHRLSSSDGSNETPEGSAGRRGHGPVGQGPRSGIRSPPLGGR
jgi:hypothetical protein